MPRKASRKYILAYDVVDDKKRNKLATLLLNYGDRVQKSVFEAELAPRDVADILRRAAEYIANEDSLRIYPLCADCAEAVQELGRAAANITETFVIV